VNVRDNKGRTALILAAEKNDEESVALILGFKADVNKKDEDGRSALHHAVSKGALGTTKLLLQNGADPNLIDGNGMSPLKNAAWLNRTDIIDILKNYGAQE
jgi:uncharacterized protein